MKKIPEDNNEKENWPPFLQRYFMALQIGIQNYMGDPLCLPDGKVDSIVDLLGRGKNKFSLSYLF